MKTFLLTLALMFCVGLLTNPVSADQAAAPHSGTTPQATQPANGKQQTASPFATILQEAKVIGTGCVTAYSKDDHTMIALPGDILGRLLLWYSEAVKLPPKAVSAAGINTGPVNRTGTTVVTMERLGKRIFIRDHSPGFAKRSGTLDPDTSYNDTSIGRGIHRSISEASNGPIIAVLPVLADGPNGEILVDITETFSKDIEALTARTHIISTGLIPAAVDPTRSYIARVQVFPMDVDIRSHLTFLATNPDDPISGPQPVSIEIGHSIILLPEKPMQARYFDNRVGFFRSKFTEYGGSKGVLTDNQGVILRRRLEKKNPGARVSDPVQPIIFYIGQDVPERWRPYLKKAVEMWSPVLEAAGFSNAIIARDAPTPEEDPDWSAEDARHNVIRWISQNFANAMGPVIYDPRSGEILSSHILVWPEVINFFERYYYAMASALDPEAAKLPFSEAKRGELLTYAVAHEVGHTLGLRHNHLASTTYSVRQMRDPAFADSHGPNSSIMAYGRFNQCAQPGDGVTRILPIIGPYDYFAIDWGYGVHGKTPEEEQAALDRLAEASETDRPITWAAGELTDEMEDWGLDPRVLKENTGAERVEATRLGVANILYALEKLNSAVGNDNRAYRQTYTDIQAHHAVLVNSVLKLVGGQYHLPGHKQELQGRFVPPEKQREAVRYLLGEGARSFEPYARPELLYRAWSTGGVLSVEVLQSALVNDLLAGSRLASLEEQKRVDASAYGVFDLADDMTAALFDVPADTTPTRQVLQNAFLERINTILHTAPDMKAIGTEAAALIKKGFSRQYIIAKLATGRKTALPAWAFTTLPQLQQRLKEARPADREGQMHIREMVRKIQKILEIQQDIPAAHIETPM